MASTSAVCPSRATLPSPVQDSLPAGGLRLYRERGSNPLDRFERFQVTSPFSFPNICLNRGNREQVCEDIANSFVWLYDRRDLTEARADPQ